MIVLMRKQFVNRSLDARDLDDALGMWQSWYEQNRGSTGSYRVEARVWCFPRRQADELRRELEAAIQREQSPLRVLPSETDTLVAGSDWLPLSEPVSGLSLPLFAGRAFENLPLMLRLENRHAAVVLCGQVCRERFQLKAAWATGPAELGESIYQMAVWARERAFLDDLDSYSANEAPRHDWKGLFGRGPSRRVAGTVAWLLVGRGSAPPGNRRGWRLHDFLARLVVFLAVTLVGLLPLFLLPVDPAATLLLGLCSVFGGLGLGWTMAFQAFILWKRYEGMNRALKLAHSQEIRHVPVDLGKCGVLNDPATCKYSDDLEALDARHHFDGRTDRALPDSDSYLRIYVLPEERMYVYLNVMLGTRTHQFFPARPVFLLKTYFEDGHQCLSATGVGFQKVHSPNVTAKRLADEYDLEPMLASHRKTVARLVAEGRKVKELIPAEQLVELMAQEHAEASGLRKRFGYFSLGAAFRQAFELPRWEFEPD